MMRTPRMRLEHHLNLMFEAKSCDWRCIARDNPQEFVLDDSVSSSRHIEDLSWQDPCLVVGRILFGLQAVVLGTEAFQPRDF